MINSINAVNSNGGNQVNFGMYIEPSGATAEALDSVVNKFSNVGSKKVAKILQGAKKDFAGSGVDLQFVSENNKFGLDFFKRESEASLDAFSTFPEKVTEKGFIAQLKKIINAAKTFKDSIENSYTITTAGAKTYVA